MFDRNIKSLAYYGSDSSQTLSDARTILRAVGAKEPGDRRAVIRLLYEPHPCRENDRSPSCWPVNDGVRVNPRDTTWAKIFGLEEGWLAYSRSKQIEWTEAGRREYFRFRQLSFFDLDGFNSEAAEDLREAA